MGDEKKIDIWDKLHCKGLAYTVCLVTPNGEDHEWDCDQMGRFNDHSPIIQEWVFDSISASSSFISEMVGGEENMKYDVNFLVGTCPKTGNRYVSGVTSMYSFDDGLLRLLHDDLRKDFDGTMKKMVMSRLQQLSERAGTTYCLKFALNSIKELEKYVVIFPELEYHFNEHSKIITRKIKEQKYGY